MSKKAGCLKTIAHMTYDVRHMKKITQRPETSQREERTQQGKRHKSSRDSAMCEPAIPPLKVKM